MELKKAFPLRYWINLGHRADRRERLEWHLVEQEITAERFPAVDARSVRKLRGYETAGRYALALTKRLAIRRAMQMDAEAVLLLEDDVVLHPNIKEILRGISLPEDWGIMHLGCTHFERPVPHSFGLVRVKYAVDHHAVAIHRRAYKDVLRILDARWQGEVPFPRASDRFFAQLHKRIPSYACFPILAWQMETDSNLTGTKYSAYHRGGSQKNSPMVTRHLLEEMTCGSAALSQEPRVGLLFLTRGDVLHPQIWRDYVEQAPDHVKIFSHPKIAKDLDGGFLQGSAIKELIETGWGDVSLVQATRNLMARALQEQDLTHFVLLSESCVPIRPLGELLQQLRLDPLSMLRTTSYERARDLQKERAAKVTWIPQACWRFHSQWWLMDRTAALWSSANDYTESFRDFLASDESYFATVLQMQGYPVDDLCRPIPSTWVKWRQDVGRPIEHTEVDALTVAEMQASGAFFARKFLADSDIGKWKMHLPWGASGAKEKI
jgi:GR25 family glycosyltransferase involved in LPS biosynthesis